MNTALWAIEIMIINTIIGAFASLLLKLGANKLGTKKDLWRLWQHPKLIGGLALYGLASIFGIYAYKGGNLNVLFPIAALTYIWSMGLAVKYLKEKMNPWKWAALVLIIMGAVLVVQ